MSALYAPMPVRDLLAALAVVWIWGINFVAMRWALDSFTPFQLGAVRYLFAVLPLVFFVRRPRVAWRWLVLYGLCQGVGRAHGRGPNAARTEAKVGRRGMVTSKSIKINS